MEDRATRLQNPDRVLRRLSPTWQLPRLTERDLLSGYIDQMDRPVYNGEEEGLTADTDIDATTGRDAVARYVGTVVHQVLQEIGRSGLAAWDTARLERCRSFWRARLATLGVPLSILDQTLADVRVTIQSVLQSGKFQWLCSDQQVQRHCEYAVSIPVAQGHRNLVIDLLLQEPDGQTWLVDYKTGRPGPDENIDHFIERRMRFYANKMELYRRAVSHLGYQRVRAALYFPMLDRWCEYTGS